MWRTAGGRKYDGHHGHGYDSHPCAFAAGSYLVDICIIYAMISFLAVIVLTKVYMGVYQETRKKDRKKDTPEEENAHES